MAKKLFSQEEIRNFQANPYVENVGKKSITYTQDFREFFVSEYQKGKLPTQILRTAGFDTSVLGRERIHSLCARFRKMEQRPEGLADTRKGNSGRPATKDLTQEEEIKIETIEDFKTALEKAGEKSCPGITFGFNNSFIAFKFYKWEASPEKIKAYTQLVALLNQSAMVQKHASFKSKDTDNDKFTFRVWLVKIGMVGDEYKIARKVLIERLEGNSAFRSGMKPVKVAAE
ncbi:hypothetical protein SBF1_2470008 [Candidatus Desulfosporosinus infrequens]|uniref:Uncharacterized protein n=1 Tax=Candidatus Desulfosporosinus infrequens TaxID=2043169 RepID=A0A2U3KNU0_9FIRM|nr:hypothetical protein SBF1_2470008 [Candidatus Desulfosporosinus infrequens]